MKLVALVMAALSWVGLAIRAARAGESKAGRPNFVLIMTDDQGYGDLSCLGNPILKTPHIDALYAQSVRLTDFHVSPTCAPTRAALMTGRHEFHSGVTHTIYERERLSLTATTIAQVLQSAGYATGIFGKWHLGDEDPYQPDRRGFDEVYIHGGGGIGQTYPGSCGDAPGNTYFDPTIKHNGTFVKTHGYCTDLFFEQARQWIEGARKKGPFFAYIPTNAAHAPLQVPPAYEARYAGKVPPDVAKFYGMIANIDDNVGRLMGKLKEWGIERDTVVIFMTDNGGTAGVKIYNAGMRGAKVTPYEGGMRVPCFFRYPGVFPAGTDVDALTAHIDLFPTLSALADAKIPTEVTEKLEGRNLAPLLKGVDAPAPKQRLIFTHVGRWPRGKAAEAKFSNCAVRSPRYHLVSPARRGGKEKPQWELYDLKADPGETMDIAADHPQVVRELAAAYDKWWASILPDLINEDAVPVKVNPFKAQYWRQFNEKPDEATLRKMDPDRAGEGGK